MDKAKTNKPAEDTANEELKSSLDFTKTRSDQFAVTIAEALGSMKFLLACILFFTAWILCNLHIFPQINAFDPFPFPILEMMVSIFAIILSVSVLINQNRQGRIDKMKQQVEFEVNVRAESEVTKILTLLHEVHRHLGLDSKEDKELEEMKTGTDIKQIHQAIDKLESKNETKKGG